MYHHEIIPCKEWQMHLLSPHDTNMEILPIWWEYLVEELQKRAENKPKWRLEEIARILYEHSRMLHKQNPESIAEFLHKHKKVLEKQLPEGAAWRQGIFAELFVDSFRPDRITNQYMLVVKSYLNHLLENDK